MPLPLHGRAIDPHGLFLPNGTIVGCLVAAVVGSSSSELAARISCAASSSSPMHSYLPPLVLVGQSEGCLEPTLAMAEAKGVGA